MFVIMTIVFLWIIFGALAGGIADIISASPHGILEDVILGVIGAFVGGFIFNLFGGPGITGFNIYSFFLAVIGALSIIAMSKLFLPHNSHNTMI